MALGHRCEVSDPKVAMWMLRPGEKERNLPNLVMTAAPSLAPLLATAGAVGAAPGCGSVALSAAAAAPARSRY